MGIDGIKRDFKRLVSGFKYALIGLWYILRLEQNARIHLVAAALVLAAGFAFGLSGGELAAIFFAVIIVFLAEVLNTAIEKTLDLIESGHSPQVAIIKDMAAGAVLVAAIGAVIIGVVIFTPYVLGTLWRN
jgi:diacylglycerol kinase